VAKTFQCSVITPEGSVFEGEAESVVIPAYDGELGILRDRAPLLARLGAGELRITAGGETKIWFIEGGFAQVLDNHVVVLTQKALRPDQIDRTAAETRLADARRMPATDEISARERAKAEASARAQLRIAG
jgi:F-type H+-transporting ATPase subunit epsilon